MVKIEKDLRQMSDEEIEIVALRWARDRQFLTNRNVNCFIAGLEMARQWLRDNLSEFLQDEGLFMCHGYAAQRIESLRKSGTPLNESHGVEFEAADRVGELLIEASRIMRENKVLK